MAERDDTLRFQPDAGPTPVTDGGAPPPTPRSWAAFDHYSFTLGTPPYRVPADVGLLANDAPGSRVLSHQILSSRGATIEAAPDGSFTYTPPSGPFWGDDHFEYAIGDGGTRVRVTIQPGVAQDLAAAAPQIGNGFTIEGPAVRSGDLPFAGSSVAGAGDVDGDGRADLLISAPGIGTAYVVFGKSSSGAVRLDQIAPNDGIRILGADSQGAPSSLASVGDVNGDGFDDIAFGVPGPGGANGPTYYVIFGGTTLRTVGSLTLSAPLSVPGCIITSESLPDDAPDARYAVAGALDINGDSFDDLIIGSSDAGAQSAAYVVFGREEFDTNSLADLASAGRGFKIYGTPDSGLAALSVAGAGDINSDGLDDIIIGAPDEADGLGRAYIAFGVPNSSDISLSNVAAGFGGFLLTAPDCCGRAGELVAAAGDINGDGAQDVLVNHVQANQAFVVFGSASSTPRALADSGFRVDGDAYGEGLGRSLGGNGDFNGDGLDDVILGTNTAIASAQTGGAYLVFGKEDAMPISAAALELAPNGGLAFLGTGEGRTSVAVPGDIDGDGLADVLVAAPSTGGATGRIYALFGWDATDSLQERDASFVGGQADDNFEYDGTPLVILAGGHGIDTVTFTGAGLILDLRRRAPRAKSIERIDLTGAGDNTLHLDDATLRRMPQNTLNAPAGLSRTLVVTGDVGDRVVLDLSGYEQRASNAGRLVWSKPGTRYGLEISPAIEIVAP